MFVGIGAVITFFKAVAGNLINVDITDESGNNLADESGNLLGSSGTVISDFTDESANNLSDESGNLIGSSGF